ncbi:MAG: carbohydrate binding family 9 domain-containing protein [Candidatus Aminicenantales bacterium]
MRTPRFLLLSLAAAVVLSSPLLGTQLKAVRVDKGPEIDGFLSDPAWQSAEAFTAFRMAVPEPNGEPTEKTELKIMFDESNLYVGVFCYDSEPARIAANTLAHDSGASQGGMGGWHRPQGQSNDIVRLLIDPFQDKRTAYIFSVNPRGARGEGLISGGEASLNWDGIWQGKSRILENGWSVEIRVPFKTISFKPGLTVWGVNVERIIARKQETIRLSGTNLDSNFNNPMEAAGLEGIEGIKQGLGITFRPYGLVDSLKDHSQPGGAGVDANAGFDLYKNFTPNLVGVVSYNMDFAETEVDERRINLTRFPLFFPEKRMFFLEGSETFNFSSSVSFRPFFSRTVGLYEGEQIPVLFGTKLYGKISRTNLSVFDVQTKKYGQLPSVNFFAARMTQDIFAESKVGWIFTNGSPTGEKNSLAGADFQYSSSKFMGNKNIMLAAWAAYNWNEKEEGRHHGFGFRADFPNDLWNIQNTYAYYGESLDPGMGYMMRRGIQTAYTRVSFQPRPGNGPLGRIVRQFFFQVSGDYYWDLAGNLETRRLEFTPLSLNTESGEQLGFEIVSNRDVLPYDFEVAEGVILSGGPYDFKSYRLNLNTASYRSAIFDLNYNFGEFYSGHYDDLNIGLAIKYKGYLNLELDTNLVRGRLPEGRFSENVYQVKADIFVSPDLGLMNYIQYDDISKQLGWSARLRWQVSPGNEIYLVYNKNWERRWDPTSRFLPMEERGVVKILLSIRP